MKQLVVLPQHFFTKSNNLYDFYLEGEIIYNLSPTMISLMNKYPLHFKLYDDDYILPNEPKERLKYQNNFNTINNLYPIAFDVSVYNPTNSCFGICTYSKYILEHFKDKVYFYSNVPKQLNNTISSLDNISILINLWYDSIKDVPKNITVVQVVYDLIQFRKDNEEYSVYDTNTRNTIYDNIKRADYLIAISEPIRQEVQKTFNYDIDKIFVIQPGVDLNIFKPTYTNYKNYNIPNEFISCSGITSNFLNGIKNIPTEFPIIDFGLVNKKFVQEVINSNIVKYRTIGWVDRNTELNIYSRSKQFLTTRQYEGFDMQPLEQLQCHTKVLQSHSNVHDEILSKFDNVLFYEDHSMNEIREFLNKETSFDHDIELIKKEYNWEIQLANFERILLKLLKERNRKGNSRVLMDVNVLQHEKHPSGIANYIKNMQKHNNNIFDFHQINNDLDIKDLNNVKYNLSENELSKYSVYLNTDLYIPPNILNILKKSNIKIWTVVYDLLIFRKQHPSYNMWGDGFRRRYKDTLQAANKIITISKAIKQELNTLFNIPLENIFIAYPGVDLNIFKPGKGKKKNYMLMNYTPIGYELFDKLNIDIKQQGNIPIENKKLLKKRLGNRYEDLGYVSQKQLIKYYQNAKQFFSAQEYEGFDMQPLEQLQCHTKVIVSHSNVHDEILPEFDNVLFYEDHSIDEINQFLEKETSFDHDIEIIKNKYNWAIQQQKISELLAFN